MEKRRMMVIGMLLCLCIQTAGCSRKDVEYHLDSEQGADSEKEAAPGSFDKADEWREQWSADGSEFFVNAKIIVPQDGQMSVIEVKEAEMDAEYKKRLITAFFPDQTVYHAEEANAGTPVEEYAGTKYLVENDGIRYAVSFDEPEEEAFSKTKSVSIYPKGYEECTALCKAAATEGAEVSFMENTTAAGEEKNQCSLTQEEAQAVVERALQACGESDLILKDVSSLVWYEHKEGDADIDILGVDGWQFTYGTGMGKTAFSDFGVEYDYSKMSEPGETTLLGYSLRNQITVTVKDEGIIGVRIDNPIEITSVTKDVELLSLEKIQMIMREEMSAHVSEYAVGQTSYNHMELIYFRIPDRQKEGYYSYVPVWRLSVREESPANGNMFMQNYILVNAIDGSVIDCAKVLAR